jgi:hypothetical protein|tara:strand:- start:267 stop:3251 length:2985 start_codon:yes stop_codon:yes gene_type:complete
MPKLMIRNFSGGLVTNQSEFDISETQYTAFENVMNKMPGRLEKFLNDTVSSSNITSLTDVQTEFVLYRTEKDGSNADTSTLWWVIGNGTVLKRQDTSTGTGGSFSDITTGWSSSPIYDFLIHNQILRISDGSFTNSPKWYGHIKRDIFGKNILLGDTASEDSTQVPRFKPVHNRMTINNWYAVNTKLEAPTIVKMNMAHDGQITLADCSYNNSTSISTENDTLALSPGMAVSGTGIPSGAFIVNVVNDQSFTINTATTGGSLDEKTLKFTTLNNDSDVGLFVYEPRHKYDSDDLENDEHNAWVNALDNETFDPADRWAVTYLYDYVQESSLSLNRDGEIGITGFEVEKGSDEESDSTATTGEALTETEGDITVSDGSLFSAYSYIKINQEIMFITAISSNTLYVRRGQLNSQAKEHATGQSIFYRSSPQKGRAINLVLNNISASGYHNPRITGLNIYWQPKDDVDWYLVETVDMNKGYSESILGNVPNTFVPGSSNLLPFFASNNYNSYALKNYGYWLPCPNAVAADDVTKSSDGSGTQFSAGSSSWTGENNDFSNSGSGGVEIAILSRKESGDSTDLSTQFNRIGAYYTRFTSISNTNSKINFRKNNNINRVQAKHTSTSANVSKQNRITTHFPLQDKVTTWYIPYDGLKLATYNSLTGRAAKTKLVELKWNTSAVVNNRAYYADVDTVDENDQTAREKNQVYFTDHYKLDEVLPGKYFDVGRNDGDNITRLYAYRNKLFVFKPNHTYVYNQRHQLERVFQGVGAVHKHAVTESPLGLVCASEAGVFSVTPTQSRELTFNIRYTYQALTFDQTAVGYNAKDSELYVMYDADDSSIYVMNLDNGSWVKRSIDATNILTRSNYVYSSDLRAQYFNVTSGDSNVKTVGTGSQNTDSFTVTTKRFDFGAPELQKRFRKINITYQSASALTVEIYAGESGTGSSVTETLTFPLKSSIVNVSKAMRAVGKTLVLKITSASRELKLDSIDIEYDVLGSNP